MKKLAILSTAASVLLIGACAESNAPLGAPTAPVASSSSNAAGSNDNDNDNEADNANESSSAERTYRVTIENLTTGQVFSPGVIATHTKKASVWRNGDAASDGIRQIAEDGSEVAEVASLTGVAGVHAVISTGAPINRIGGIAALPQSRSYMIGAAGSANRLSVAVMIICTNDGFTGVSGVKLPGGFKAESHMVGAWDAGTEQNNEKLDQIVDPCGAVGPVASPPDGNGRIATSGVIATHPNIQGVGDLSVEKHGWRGAVARITVQRMR